MLVGTVEATLLVLLVVIVFGPIIAERFRVPGLIGLIFGGVIFGPFVLGWVEAQGLVAELGAVGILYLMFLAGLSFNLRAFVENRNNAVVYGLLGFVIPFGLSLWVAMSISDIGFLGAALIGAMWASNTLVAYPDVKAAGLVNNRAVSSAVSAGVVADLLSLSVLAIATATAVIDRDGEPTVRATVDEPTLPLWIAMPLLVAFTLWLLPKATEWFFVRVGRSRTQRFVFALAGMAAGATVALLGGIEGLIGAFLAGLGMNRLIPARSTLMDRLDFVGSAIFVPAFLVSIGLSINPAVLFDAETVLLGVLFTGLVIVGKTIAASITGLVFKLSFPEVGLMASLSFGQAASTLAIAQVGFSLGMFGQNVVNAAVLAIVATALITSFGTRFFIRIVPRPAPPPSQLGDQVLVDVRPNGSSLPALLAFAGSVARPDDGIVIPFAVPGVDRKDEANAMLAVATDAAASQGLDTDPHLRVDDAFLDGTLNLIAQVDASLLVLSWTGPRFSSDFMYGNEIDAVGAGSPIPTVAARILREWNRVVMVTGDVSVEWHREDAEIALALVRRLRRTSPMPLLIVTPDPAFVARTAAGDETVEVISEPQERRAIGSHFAPDDLLIVPAHVIHDLPPIRSWRVSRNLDNTNLAIVAGPHRLAVSRGVTRGSVPSVVGVQV